MIASWSANVDFRHSALAALVTVPYIFRWYRLLGQLIGRFKMHSAPLLSCRRRYCKSESLRSSRLSTLLPPTPGVRVRTRRRSSRALVSFCARLAALPAPRLPRSVLQIPGAGYAPNSSSKASTQNALTKVTASTTVRSDRPGPSPLSGTGSPAASGCT